MNRISEILHDEGLAGIYSRLRYPKGRTATHDLPPIAARVQVIGGDATLAASLRQMLRMAGRPTLPEGAAPGTTRFHIDPDFTAASRHDERDVLILTSRTRADLAQVILHGRGCHALIGTVPARLDALIASGLPAERLFLAAEDVTGFRRGLFRFLVAGRAVDPDAIDWRSVMPEIAPATVPRLCLGLPETPARRASFQRQPVQGFRVFDGLRYDPGWIGAALSFRTMARACLDAGAPWAIFCEDDMLAAPEFEARLQVVQDYLRGVEWDVFSGLSTHVRDDYALQGVARFGGETFLHLDRTAGMVFNIFNRRALEWLADWRMDDHGARRVTIDRHLEAMPGMRVVTTRDFLVDHSDLLSSTAWGFSNRRYRSLIAASQRRLQAKAMQAPEGAIA